jgi:hypothetical protein
MKMGPSLTEIRRKTVLTLDKICLIKSNHRTKHHYSKSFGIFHPHQSSAAEQPGKSYIYSYPHVGDRYVHASQNTRVRSAPNYHINLQPGASPTVWWPAKGSSTHHRLLQPESKSPPRPQRGRFAAKVARGRPTFQVPGAGSLSAEVGGSKSPTLIHHRPRSHGLCWCRQQAGKHDLFMQVVGRRNQLFSWPRRGL